MKIQLKNLQKYSKLIFFDIEYDQTSIVQLAMLVFDKVEPCIYELTASINIYVRQLQKLNPFFVKYTNITDKFLAEKGVSLEEAQGCVNSFLAEVELNSTLVISHGVKNDLDMLLANGFNLKVIPNHFCTYNAAKRIFKRNERLSLKDIAAEGCFIMYDEHNAYADVWGTVFAFTELNKRDG